MTALSLAGILIIVLHTGGVYYMIHGYLLQLKSSRVSPYLEDIPDIPDGHHDVWNHYHLTIFHLWQLKPSRASPYLEDIPENIPDHPDLIDGYHDV